MGVTMKRIVLAALAVLGIALGGIGVVAPANATVPPHLQDTAGGGGSSG
jgi:hypothetical protein